MLSLSFANCLVISSYVKGKCNALNTLGMTSNEAKMGQIGCLVGHATDSDSGILDSEHISKHSQEEEKPETF